MTTFQDLNVCKSKIYWDFYNLFGELDLFKVTKQVRGKVHVTGVFPAQIIIFLATPSFKTLCYSSLT